MSVFYANYVRLCNSCGKTPSAAALEIGLSKAAVTGWKRGRTNPTDATLHQVAEYFGVTVEELMADNEKKPAPNAESELDIREFVCSLTREQLLDLIVEARLRLLEME